MWLRKSKSLSPFTALAKTQTIHSVIVDTLIYSSGAYAKNTVNIDSITIRFSLNLNFINSLTRKLIQVYINKLPSLQKKSVNIKFSLKFVLAEAKFLTT